VIQRVLDAEVSVDGQIISSIGNGLLILIAAEHTDTLEDVQWLVHKVARLRIFPDQQGLMNLSVTDVNGETLVVSQFTLFASTKRGNRPSFTRASSPENAEELISKFVSLLSTELGKPVKTGVFGAHMLVKLTNNGPVTIIIDSKLRE
jgi:D-tyrosyl-tRNA(Tyr) deacylase